MVTFAFIIALGLRAPTVSYATPAIRMDRFAVEFSASSGIALSVSPNLKNDVICVRFNDVPVRTALERIASTMYCTVRPQGDSFMLVRTSEDLREMTKVDKANFANAIALAQSEMREELRKALATPKPQKSGIEYVAVDSLVGGNGPVAQVLRQFICSISPRDLASIEPGDRIVWSTSPNSLQIAFDRTAAPILDSLNEVRNRWKKSKTATNGPDLDDYAFGEFGNPKAGPVSKVIVSAKRNFMSHSLSFSLLAADDKGKVAAQFQEEFVAKIAKAPDSKSTVDRSGAIAPSPDDVELSQFGDEPPPSSKRKPISASLRQKLLNSVAIEPLGLLASPVFSAYSVATKQNLVANLGDATMTWPENEANPITAAKLWNAIYDNENVRTSESDGWIVAKPTFPGEMVRSRCDRKVLQEFVRSSDRHRTLDERAHFALSLPSGGGNELSWMVNTILSPNDAIDGEGGFALRLYGRLDESQRKAMRSGGVLFRNLTLSQQQEVVNAVYRTQDYTVQWFPGAQRGPNAVLVENPYESLMREPTEALPGGVPPDAQITMEGSTQAVVRPKFSTLDEIDFDLTGMEPYSVAWKMFTDANPNIFGEPGDHPKVADFSVVQHTDKQVISFHIQHQANLMSEMTFTDSDFFSAKWLKWSEIPEDFRKEVESHLAEFKRDYADIGNNIGSGRSGAKGIPPPR